MRSATPARLLLGCACLAVPGSVLRALGAPDQSDRRVRLIARALGGRLLLQAGLDVVRGPCARRLDVAIELTHAASMVPAAVIWPVHRRTATASAAIATGIAMLDLIEMETHV
jgi:hypothetical protein